MGRSLDQTLEAIAALPDEVRALRAELADLRRAVDAAQPESLTPLSDILGCSKRAALGRLTNDPELRALGLRVGRQLRFRRHEVEALLAERQRDRSGLRAVAI